MATKTIAWGDGSGDNITFTYGAASGNQSVSVSSSPNRTGSKRTKSVTISTTSGGVVTKTLTIAQPSVTVNTLTLYPSAWVSGQYASISGQTNPVGKGSTSTSYATMNLKTGSRAETWGFWKFDTSSIPSNAEIVSVECTAKCYISSTQSNRITTRTVQMYSGTTTAKGTASTVSNSTTAFNVSCGTWTRAELDNCYIRVYGVRGTSSTSTTYYFRFYGATLTIKYI